MPTAVLVQAIVASLFAALTIATASGRLRRLAPFHILKPLTTILILLIALLPGTFPFSRYAALLCLGLSFSLIGDILLIPRDRYFLHGLVSFLIALLLYALAFAPGVQFAYLLLPTVVLLVIGGAIQAYLWRALPIQLRIPVSLYVSAMVAMTALAFSRLLASPSAGALTAAIGAALFMISDSLLAVDRFRGPLCLADGLVLGTYFSGQLLIALSVPLAGA